MTQFFPGIRGVGQGESFTSLSVPINKSDDRFGKKSAFGLLNTNYQPCIESITCQCSLNVSKLVAYCLPLGFSKYISEQVWSVCIFRSFAEM